jgi:hypothetical protein
MRVTLFLIILTCFLGLFLWSTLSGALFFLGSLFLILFIIISIGYSDTAILFFLGAREIKSSDEADFYAAAAQEAYKLAVSQPNLYFYNGALERAFVLQNKKSISLVLSKDLLEICTKEELAAICFELLIQVKKNLASKRTKVMFVVGLASWFGHGMLELLVKLFPFQAFRQSMNWLLNYLLQPWLELIFNLTLGEKYFRKLETLLKEYPLENDLLLRVGSKLRRPKEIYSVTSRKMIEFSSVNKSRHFQNILTLEFLPHEWDLIFDPKSGE